MPTICCPWKQLYSWDEWNGCADSSCCITTLCTYWGHWCCSYCWLSRAWCVQCTHFPIPNLLQQFMMNYHSWLTSLCTSLRLCYTLLSMCLGGFTMSSCLIWVALEECFLLVCASSINARALRTPAKGMKLFSPLLLFLMMMTSTLYPSCTWPAALAGIITGQADGVILMETIWVGLKAHKFMVGQVSALWTLGASVLRLLQEVCLWRC